jgi:hypothetical protein
MTNRIWALAGLSIAVLAPGGARAQVKRDTIPFVGCPADGQTGYIAPPQGSPKLVVLHGVPPHAVAYYEGEPGPGVFAPRGWHCQVAYGSSGTTVVVTPDSIDLMQYPAPRVRGPAVELALRLAGTSGRFSVARYASRLFPAVVPEFIARVKREGLVSDSEFTAREYARDSVWSLDKLMAEFITPAGATGLGTAGYLDPSADPVHGVAVIEPTPEEPDITIFRIRLGSGMRQLEAALLELNRACLRQRGGC